MESGAGKAASPLLALAAIVLAIAGCGSGSSTAAQNNSPSPTGTTSASSATAPAAGHGAESRAQFIAQADSICARLNSELNAVKVKNGSAKEIERVVPRNASLEKQGVVALEKLKPPQTLESSWRQMLSYRQTLAGELPKLVAAAKRNDLAAARKLSASKKREHARLLKMAKTNGFKDCGAVG